MLNFVFRVSGFPLSGEYALSKRIESSCATSTTPENPLSRCARRIALYLDLDWAFALPMPETRAKHRSDALI